MFFDKRIKKLNVWDIALTKLAVTFFVLFILAIWPTAIKWVQSVNPWYFCVAWILLAARPIYRLFR